MQKILLYIGIIVPLLQLIAAAVKEVEESTEGKRMGETKKETVLELIEKTYDSIAQATTLQVTKTYVLSVSSAIIDVLVTFYNAVGLFRREV